MSTTLDSPCPTSEKRWAAKRPTFGKSIEELAMRLMGRLSCLPHVCLGSRTAGKIGLLTYHRVIEHTPGIARPLHNVTPARFKQQIAGLLRQGWSVWPLQMALEARQEPKPFPPRTMVITFDDGFESVYQRAWPLLREWKIPFTVFVNTQYLDGEDPFPFDLWGLDYRDRVAAVAYRPLRSAQCQEMLDSGLAELGAHTHSHEDFRGRPDAFRHDLAQCVAILRERFGIADPTFAFPYGSPRLGFASPELQQAARQTGVRCGLTTQAILNQRQSDPFSWGRFNVFPWDSCSTLSAKLEGWYSWTNRLRSWCSLSRAPRSTYVPELSR